MTTFRTRKIEFCDKQHHFTLTDDSIELTLDWEGDENYPCNKLSFWLSKEELLDLSEFLKECSQ